jgi:hypothetical protein
MVVVENCRVDFDNLAWLPEFVHLQHGRVRLMRFCSNLSDRFEAIATLHLYGERCSIVLEDS